MFIFYPQLRGFVEILHTVFKNASERYFFMSLGTPLTGTTGFALMADLKYLKIHKNSKLHKICNMQAMITLVP